MRRRRHLVLAAWGPRGFLSSQKPQRTCVRPAVCSCAMSMWGDDSPGEGAQPQGHVDSASLPLGGDGWGLVRCGSTLVRTVACHWATWRARRQGGVKAGPRSGQGPLGST